MTVKPVTAGRRIVHVNNDNGACRCDKIRGQFGGKATHTRGQCRHLPDPKTTKD